MITALVVYLWVIAGLAEYMMRPERDMRVFGLCMLLGGAYIPARLVATGIKGLVRLVG